MLAYYKSNFYLHRALKIKTLYFSKVFNFHDEYGLYYLIHSHTT